MILLKPRIKLARQRYLLDQKSNRGALDNLRYLVLGHVEHISSGSDTSLNAGLKLLLDHYQLPIPAHFSCDISTHQLDDVVDSVGLVARPVLINKQNLNKDLGPILVVDKEHNAWLAQRKGDQYLLDDGSLLAELLLSDKTTYTVTPKIPETLLTLKSWLLFGTRWLQPEMCWFVVMTLTAAIFTTALPMLTALVINDVVPGNDHALLLHIATLVMLLLLFQTLANAMLAWIKLRMDIRAGYLVLPALVHRVMRFAAVTELSPTRLALQVQLAMQLRKGIHGAAMQGATGAVYLSSSAVIMLIYQPAGALAILALIGVILSLLVGIGMRRQKVLRQGQALDMSSADKLFDMLSSLSLIRSFGLEKHFFSRWADNYAMMRSKLFKAKRLYRLVPALEKSWPLLLMLAGYGVASLGHLPANQQGSFLAFATAMATAMTGLALLASALQEMFVSLPMVGAIKPLLQYKPAKKTRGLTPSLRGKLELINVSCQYPTGENALSNINLNVEAGEYIGIVGGSGSGKSTLINVLLGLQASNRGELLFDGIAMNKLDHSALRRQLGLVMQDQKLLPGTLFENISGLRPISLEQAWHAAEQAALADDIRALPMGMFTVFSDAAEVLSGGQIQRILLARALAVKSPILVLDEATSALDKRTQKKVCQSLVQLKCTRIVVAHRLATVRDCDRILVLDKGKLVASGSWQELAQLPGVFQSMLAHEVSEQESASG